MTIIFVLKAVPQKNYVAPKAFERNVKRVC